MKNLENQLLNLYAAAIDSGMKKYIDKYNKLIVEAVKECLAKKDDTLIRNIAIRTEYETQYEAMLKLRIDFFGYNVEEQQTALYNM